MGSKITESGAVLGSGALQDALFATSPSEECATLLPRTGSYIDTVCSSIKRPLPGWLRAAIEDDLAKQADPNKKRLIYDPHTFSSGGRDCMSYVLKLHQPTPWALWLLKANHSAELVRVDIALDVFAESVKQAHLLREQMRSCLVMKGFTRREWESVAGPHTDRKLMPRRLSDSGRVVSYLGGRVQRGHEFLIYSDRPSKIDGQSNCAHIELRLRGAGALRKAGLYSIGDLLRLDHRAFWQPRLQMRDAPTVSALANVFDRWRPASSEYAERYAYEKARKLLERCRNAYGDVIVADLLRKLYTDPSSMRARPIRLFKQIDASHLLPPARNSLWTQFGLSSRRPIIP